MHEAAPVGFVEALADLERQVDRHLERQLGSLVESGAQALSLE